MAACGYCCPGLWVVVLFYFRLNYVYSDRMETKSRGPKLGKFIWDDDYDSWATEARFAADLIVHVTLDIDQNRNEDRQKLLDRANTTWKILRSREAVLREVAAADLLDIYNSGWNKGEDLLAEQFMEKMRLHSVSLHADGAVSIYYDDGGLFGGRSIAVFVDSDGNVQEIEF